MGQVGPWMPVRPSSRFSGVFLMVRELHHEIDLTACKVLPIRRRAGSWSYFFERFACGMLAVVVLLIAAHMLCREFLRGRRNCSPGCQILQVTPRNDRRPNGTQEDGRCTTSRLLANAACVMLRPRCRCCPSVPVPQSFDQLLLQLSSVAGFSTDARLLIAANSADPLPGFQRRL